MEATKTKNTNKKTPVNIRTKNSTIERIIELIVDKEEFLLLGHEYADEDCVSSMVAMALLLKKFKKNVTIFLEEPIHPQLHFFVNICSYNKITILFNEFPKIKKIDAIFIMDTPKPEMIGVKGHGLQLLKDKTITKVELDHHFSADANFSGDPGYRLTMRASSTGEIIAHICAKLEKRPDFLRDNDIRELYSRNIVLAILTGMIGDARLGNYLFKKRDQLFYEYFLKKFNNMLHQKFYQNSKNISSVEEILNLLDTLSAEDSKIFKKVMNLAKYKEKIGLIILDKTYSEEMALIAQHPVFVDIIKRATNAVAEKVNCIGISAYYDPKKVSDKIQFRVRAAEKIKGIDLRPILEELKASDGGGHPGAIAFRFPRTKIKDIHKYTDLIVEKVDKLIQTYLQKNEKK